MGVPTDNRARLLEAFAAYADSLSVVRFAKGQRELDRADRLVAHNPLRDQLRERGVTHFDEVGRFQTAAARCRAQAAELRAP